ncbi:unnamed protein product [Auanema sp. JU1783]|nr:unnamed protein product [Auanema sp. JU1783]
MPSLIIAQLGYIENKSFFLFGLNGGSQPLMGSLGLIVLIHRFSIILYRDQRRNIFRTISFITNFVNIVFPSYILYYFTVSYDSELAAQHLLQDCPHFFPILSYEFVYMYHPRTTEIVMFLLTFYISFNMIWFTCLLQFCLRKFREKTGNFSETTRKIQTRLMINMALTISIPFFLHITPACILSVFLAAKTQITISIPTVLWYMSEMHPILNCVASISLNEHYLKKFKNDLRLVSE